MARVSFGAIRQASRNRLLGPLLHAFRSIEQAQRELRWIQQELPQEKWTDAVHRRSRHEPLQYILGTQPFGNLDIRCEPGVLIPRWETEEWTLKLAEQLRQQKWVPEQPRILDACTGTGCIALLLREELARAHVEAFDVAPEAVKLARRNGASSDVKIHQADVLDGDVYKKVWGTQTFDIVTSNPPYIPDSEFRKPASRDGVEKSVRAYEPRRALVGDSEFYEALVKNVVLPSQCKAFVFELAYRHQADATRQCLGDDWTVREYADSAGRLRCVWGYVRGHDIAMSDSMTAG